MSLSAAASGLVVVFLSVQVVQAQNGYGVTYSSTRICALKGSTVVISCNYTYPYKVRSRHTTVGDKIWFSKMNGNEPVDLRSDSKYSGRVWYSDYKTICYLRITDVRESDSAEYKFRFTTNQPGGSYTGSPGVTLSVTDLQVKVETSSHSTWTTLECHSSCSLPDRPSYVWYKNGQYIQTTTSYYYSPHFSYKDSYSCAVRGHEELPSPPVCVAGQSCNRVTYTSRSICAYKGSTVNVSCSYHSYNSITSKLWFRPYRSHRWWDLQTDSQSAGRVQVFETEKGLSTLRISDLTESDSAEYRFKFTTQSFEWGSSLPGTTLTVTALQVKVTRKPLTTTKVELKCESSCRPADRLSYVWFKNGQEVTGEETSSYEGWFSDGDVISCALRGHESVRSPSVYAPKLPSVSVSPSGEIVEGSSVNLSCSSDANPPAKYTWYKDGNLESRSVSKPSQLVFRSIKSSDSGRYHCVVENELGRTSESISVDVKYGPKFLSVSMSPSSEIVEGSSVTLSCSSDANPAANYTWYKEDEESPKASGPTFIITDFRPEHSGNYYCEAFNSRGRRNSTIKLTVVTGSMVSVAAGATAAFLLVIIFLFAFLWIRRKRSVNQTERPGNKAQLNGGSGSDDRSAAVQRNPAEQQDDLHYASVTFSKNQEDPLYSNIRAAQTNRHSDEEEDEDGVEYSVVMLKGARASPESGRHAAVDDSTALYSTVTKPRV